MAEEEAQTTNNMTKNNHHTLMLYQKKKKKDVQKAVNSLTDSSSRTMEPIMKRWLNWKDDNMILAW